MDAINRTFVGIRVPAAQFEQICQKLILVKRKPGVENLRWNAQSELLLSIAPLGELGIATLSAIRPAIRETLRNFPVLNLQIKGFGGLPNQIQPRYLTAEIGGPDTVHISEMSAAIYRALLPFIPPREHKEIRPHILLARIKTESESNRVALGRAIKLPEQPDMGDWRIERIELLISNASESGIGYTVVDEFSLG